ncbi:MAG: M23 family metallopeptidase [Saprospiraceae bacterium]|nr:M23 family metallopeptidase [Saprospiraceae bacterium]
MKYIILFTLLLSAHKSYSTIWQVGPGKQYTSPSKVSSLVKNFDTINIEAGIYPQDVCFWTADHLLIRGINGKAHLKSGGRAAGQKAIWVIQGDSTIIENIEFSECKVPDKNGAGIRLEATHLVVRNCYFHHNETGILGGDNVNSNVLIEFSEFGYNGYGDGFSHNLYLNHIKNFIFRFNYSHNATIGHLVKSRAHNNYILYNRLTQEKGNGSFEIDLPNGGYSVVIGNIIQQGQNSENGTLIAYGEEGLNNPTPNQLILSHNTVINERQNGTFILVKTGMESLLMINNAFSGTGTFMNGTPNKMEEFGTIRNTNLNSLQFKNSSNFDYTPTELSPCFNKGFFSTFLYPQFTPTFQYKHPAQFENRDIELIHDVGAIEAHFLNPFITPVKGQYKKDFVIVNYVDWSNAGIQDGWCGTQSYDGHQGTDYVLDGFISMSSGVPVVAVDSGVVTSIKNGLFDKETTSQVNKGLGNYVCIKHSGKYYTYYAHLKNNSITVKPGDRVTQNQILGEIGSSGNSTDPHLHFEFWWDSTILIDPFKTPCGNVTSFWKDQLVYDTSHYVWRSGMLSGLTVMDSLRFNNYQKFEFDIDKDYYATYWNLGHGLRKGDRYSFQWYNEAGIKVWQVEDISDADYWYYYLWSNVDIKNLGSCNKCEIRYLINNQVIEKKNFSVRKLSSTQNPNNSRIYTNHIGAIIPEEYSIVDCFDITGKKVPYNQSGNLLTWNNNFNGILFVRYFYNNNIYTQKLFSSLN